MKQFGNNLLRKCLAVFFAALMVFSILPMSALAEAFESLADEGTAEIGTLSKDDISKLESRSATKAITYTYERATAPTAGETYIIVAGGQGVAVSNNIVSSNHYLDAVTVTENSDNTLTVDSSVSINEILWTAGGNADDGWTFQSVDDGTYMGLDSTDYLAPSTTAVAWLYSGNDLNNQIDSEGYYYLNYSSANTLFTTSKNTGNNIVLYKQVEHVGVDAVELDTPVHAMAVGATKQLTAYVMPVDEADDASVTWTSNNTSVATVSSSGLVTAKANGTATITVTTTDGGYTDTCVVTVTSNPTKQVTYYERSSYAYPGADYLIGASDSSSNFYLMSGTAASSSSLSGTQTALTTVGAILGTNDTTVAVAGSSAITNAYTWTVGADIAHGQYVAIVTNKATGYYLTHGTTTTDGGYASLSTGTSTSSGRSYWQYITLNDGGTAICHYYSSMYYSVALSGGVFKAAAYSSATVYLSEFYRKYTVTVEDTTATPTPTVAPTPTPTVAPTPTPTVPPVEEVVYYEPVSTVEKGVEYLIGHKTTDGKVYLLMNYNPNPVSDNYYLSVSEVFYGYGIEAILDDENVVGVSNSDYADANIKYAEWFFLDQGSTYHIQSAYESNYYLRVFASVNYDDCYPGTTKTEWKWTDNSQLYTSTVGKYVTFVPTVGGYSNLFSAPETATANSTIQLYAKRTVTTAEPTLVLDKTAIALSVKDNPTADITATVENLPEGATPTYTWEVDDDTVASVTGNGSVANITAHENGSTFLTCTVTFGDTTLTAEATIKVEDMMLVSISLDPQSVILSMDNPDVTAEVTATVITNPDGGVIGTDYDLVWTSSSPNFATVTPIDGTNKATIIPVAAGSTTITCVAVNKYDQTQTVRYTCNVVVKTAGQIPAPETGVGEEDIYEKVFVLVDYADIVKGKNYMILEGGSGNTYAIYDPVSSSYLDREAITVQSGTAGVQGKYGKYVTSPSDTYIWYLTTSTAGNTLLANKSGDCLDYSSGYAILTAGSGEPINIVNVTGTTATTDVRIKRSSYAYYLYYDSSYGYIFDDEYAKSFYFYEETAVHGTTAVQSGVDIYCDGTRISQQEYKVQASSQTTKTLEATPLNVPASATGGAIITWSIYSQSSPAIASIEDPSTGVVTFTGKTGYAVVKVTYEYVYGGTTYTVTNYTKLVVENPEPESADDTVTTTTKIFQLVSNFVDGGNYIIVYNKNAAATDAQVLYPQSTEYTGTYSGSSGDVDYKEYLVGITSDIVINAADSISSVPYIVTDNYNMVWNYEALSSGGVISNVGLGGYAMCEDIDIDSNNRLLTANDRLYIAMYYNTSNHYLYYTEDTWFGTSYYYIGTQDDTTYALGFSTDNGYPFYLYKEVELTSTTTGKVGIDIYNGATCVSGTTVDVSGTSIQLSQQNNLSSLVTNETVTWEIVDSKIATVDQNGLVTITDTTGGEALVKVTLTWTGSDGTTKTATNYVTIRVASGDVLVDTGDTENFPEYPNEGSIRIEKNAYTAEGTDYYNTGVGTVELFARGVPMNSKPVDVVLVIDVSGSMKYDISGNQTSVAADQKITLAKTAAKAFVEKLLKSSTGYSDNRVAIVTFSDDANIITGTGTAAPSHNALIQVGNDDQLDSLNGVIDGIFANGGTNYDAALQYAYEILKSARSQPGYSREQFVVFLTDGAPGWYNQMSLDSATFPKSSYTTTLISTMSSLWYKWTTGVAPTASDWSGMTDPVETAFEKYKFADHHYAAAIKARSFSALNMRQDVRSELGITSTLGATIYGISLGMAGGSQITGFTTSSDTEWTSFTAAQCTDLINRIVGSSNRVFAADDTDQLNEAFQNIGSAILLAGTNAVVTDVIHPNFELQTADYGNITEYPDYNASEDSDPKSASIEVRKYTVGTDGNRTGAYETLERVTFSTDGTAAYSNVLGSSNILSYKEDGSYTITASLFTYESATKTFTWRIGDITANDMAIRYNVYLTDTRNTAEGLGARTGGRYDTNAQAYITYENHMGNRCKKVYEVPALPWASAIVTYRFYLVNAEGEPVNSSGQLVDYNNLTYLTEEKKVDMTRIVNTTTGGFNYDYTLYAAELKAGISRLNGFELYDSAAAYTVNSNGRGGDQGTGKYIVTVGNGKVNTTVVRNAPGATPYAKPAGETNTAGDYTNTVVEFAVIWAIKVIPDAVVIDYGLPVSIPVVNNDLVSSVSGTLYGIYAGKADAANASTPYTDSESTATMGGSLRLTYGTASIVDATHIEYTPTSMSMNGVEEFYYEVTYKGVTQDYYLTTSIQVIPATTVYYEDNFTGSDGVTFTNGVGGQAQWQVVGSATATVQDTDYVGEGGNYGHDSHYEQGMTYSLSSAHKITVTQEHYDAVIANDDELDWPTASFTFTGTGFDVVSLCNADSGIITVEVTNEEGNRVTSFFVNTYYEGTQVIVDDNMYQIPVINCYDLPYDTYNVVITTPYVPILDSTNAGGDGSYDLYIDGVRIYNPAQGDETATNAYIEDNEGYPIFKEMRDMLLTSVQYNPEGGADIEFGGAMFVDGIAATAFASDYADIGPNNEIYLAPGQGIAFALRTTEAKPTGIYFGMKSPNGEAIAAVEGNHTGASIRNTINLNTTSDMYYEIPADALGEWKEENNTWTSGYLVITNVSPVDSGRVIALTNLKTAFASEGKYDIVLLSNAPSAVNAHEMIRSGMIDLYGHEYDMDIHAARAANTTVTLGNPIVFTVVTSTDVDELVIMEGRKTEVQPDSISCVDGENGQRTWTVTIATKTTGFKLYDIKGVGDFGIATETAKVVSVIVTKKASFGQSPILAPFPVSVEK